MTNTREEDSSDSDDEDDLARLREAVDCDTLTENLYLKNGSDSVPQNEVNDKDSKDLDNVEPSSEACPVAVDNPKLLSDSIKAIIIANATKVKPQRCLLDAPSLRRDRQEDSKPAFVSELDVTPQFQKFVANKLGDLLDRCIKDKDEGNDENVDVKTDQNELKLLKRSNLFIKEVEESSIKRIRPELLAHRKPELSSEELSSCSVTGEFVLSQVEVGGWVNKFAGRVEEGVERIKKKKKKVKKKKKTKEASTSDKIAVNDEKLLNESVKITA
eukprot:GFUD01034254.1.p1 GENE.GFUD01034254.1~~GFUD01034254.1.p1  ORF type:complete len:272 (+),score=75.20 GFUD01034254.1:71-886(+)